MSLPLGEGALLGLVQGITEYLPVSSGGHLALAELLFGSERSDANLASAVLLHVGTLAATCVALRRRLGSAIEEGLRGIGRPALLNDTPGGRDASFVAVATVPTVIVGMALRHRVESSFTSLFLIGGCFLVTAIVLAATRFQPAGRHGPVSESTRKGTPGWAAAMLFGLAQGVAVVPGISRPAVTIAALLWMGVGAERAFELSFLASIPVVAGAIALEARHALHGDEALAALGLEAIVAFVAGLGTFYLARRIVTRGRMHWLAFYLVPLAFATLAWGYARP
jgi:undecaprenyl-diphosphatase